MFILSTPGRGSFRGDTGQGIVEVPTDRYHLLAHSGLRHWPESLLSTAVPVTAGAQAGSRATNGGGNAANFFLILSFRCTSHLLPQAKASTGSPHSQTNQFRTAPRLPSSLSSFFSFWCRLYSISRIATEGGGHQNQNQNLFFGVLLPSQAHTTYSLLFALSCENTDL